MDRGTNPKCVLLLSLYGLTMIWSPMFGTSEATVFSSLAPHHDELFVSRVVSLAGFGLSMLALSLFGERVRKNADRFPMRKVFVAIGAAGMLAGSLVGLGLLPLTFLYAGSLFRGVYCAAIAVMWVDLFTKLDWKTIGASVSAALVVYAVAGLAIGAAAQLSAQERREELMGRATIPRAPRCLRFSSRCPT